MTLEIDVSVHENSDLFSALNNSKSITEIPCGWIHVHVVCSFLMSAGHHQLPFYYKCMMHHSMKKSDFYSVHCTCTWYMHNVYVIPTKWTSLSLSMNQSILPNSSTNVSTVFKNII